MDRSLSEQRRGWALGSKAAGIPRKLGEVELNLGDPSRVV